MKLYVCWGTFGSPRPGGHPCGNAYHTLRDAGWDPEVKKVYGWGLLPSFMNPGRKVIRDMTGQEWVPVLETDDGEILQGTKPIADWAKANPAAASDAAAHQSG